MPPQKHLCKQSVACCQGLMRTPIFKLILYDEKQHVPMLMTIALKMMRYSLKKGRLLSKRLLYQHIGKRKKEDWEKRSILAGTLTH